MKLAVMAMAAVFLSLAAEARPGFQGGNNRDSILATGRIIVQCTDPRGPNMGHFACEWDILTPTEYDYFVGPENVAADEVTLVATHQDGSKRTKSVKYDSAKARSRSQINLWVVSLTQKPLLEMGKNQVKYTMKLKGKVVAEGEFETLVNDGGRRVCSRAGYYGSGNSLDCQTGGSFCTRYFHENNYCL